MKRHVPFCRVLCCVVVLLLVLASMARATENLPVPPSRQTDTRSRMPSRLAPLGLERLMEIEVTTVSRKPERIADAPAAIYVLTGEDIRRLGVTSIPDALRYVPGVDVARIDSHRFAVSVRGFNSEWVSKLQVLIDGRSVYGPLFSGERWDEKDSLLEDIDRIEVIRGPGGALWGANAVNGIINVITKKAGDTQGWLTTAGGGINEQGFAALRYGGKLGQEGFFRVYAKGFSRDDLEGGDEARDWRQVQTGFRIDRQGPVSDTFTFQGDLYAGQAGDSATVPTSAPPFKTVTNATPELSGGNLLGRWIHKFDSGSESILQMFYDRTDRRNAFWVVREVTDTVDVDFQHRFQWGQRHEIVWGAGYRYLVNSTDSSFTTTVSPGDSDLQLGSGFIQDTFGIVPDKVDLTLGTKLEHNRYTGFEIMPNLRAVWRPDSKSTVWAAVSRAIRMPSRFDTDMLLRLATLPDNSILTIVDDSDFDSERLLAYEFGYRAQPHRDFSFEIASFYNVYDDLKSFEFIGLQGANPSELRFITSNKLYGHTYGAEVNAQWQINDWWTILPSYTFLQMDLHRRHDSTDPLSGAAEDQSPMHQSSIRSMMNFGSKWELDIGLRYVDHITALVDGTRIPGYFVADVRLGWRPSAKWEFAFIAQNLLKAPHAEFRSFYPPPDLAKVPQIVFGKVMWKF